MGQQQSKDELLYHQVSYGNVEGIKALRREGAGLEWIDKEGKTPLIVACMMPDCIHVAKTLIELGANLNAYRPGSHAGTPLHHAAKRGLEQTVKLLLYHGANAIAMNDDCQTPLDLARAKGHTNVVRAIESHICQFSGWLRELNGPSFLEALAPQWVSRKIWAVVIPCQSRNPRMPPKFELAIYAGLEIAQPRTVIQLWKSKIERPKFNQPDPALVILDKPTKTKFKFLSANEGDKQQLEWFHNACIGMLQLPVTTPAAPASGAATAPTYSLGQQEVPMPISSSMQSAMQQRPPIPPNTSSSELSNTSGWESSVDNASLNGWGPQTGAPPPSKVSSSDGGWIVESAGSSINTGNGWSASGVGQSSNPAEDHLISEQTIPSTQSIVPLAVPSIPSAPPAPDYDGPVHYPTIDVSAINLFIPDTETTLSEDKQDNDDSSALCAICLDAPKEGACVPCGHVVGCMSCLNDIKAKDWGCPVCRTKISQVIKLYKV